MTSRRIAIAAAALLQLLAFSLDAQVAQLTLSPPTPQTRQQLTTALQESREKKDRHGEALALLQLGIAEAGLGNVTGARSNLTEAVGKMRAQNDPLGAMALFTLSQIEVALAGPAEAIPHVEKALTVLSEAKVSTAPFTFKTLIALSAPTRGIAAGNGPDAQRLQCGNGEAVDDSVFLRADDARPVRERADAGRPVDKAEAELKAAAAGSVYTQGIWSEKARELAKKRMESR